MFLISRLLSAPLLQDYRVRRAGSRIIPDRLYARVAFRRAHGRFPASPPATFDERISALIASGNLDHLSPYSDKLAVRDIVAQKAGAKYLVPLFATADRLTPDLWGRLPNAFMLKPSHGSGWTRLVRDKRQEDFDALAALTDGWLRQNYYHYYRESQYRPIEPVLLFEEVLDQGGGRELIDYKFFCFRGKPMLVYVVPSRRRKRRLLYDLDWNKLDVRYVNPNDMEHPRPAHFDEMRAIAETLAQGFDFVRVDLFSVPKGPFFGELTFTPLAGSNCFDPPEFDRFLGDLWGGKIDPDGDVMARWRMRPPVDGTGAARVGVSGRAKRSGKAKRPEISCYSCAHHKRQ